MNSISLANDFKNISNEALIEDLRQLTRQERVITRDILERICEVERRKLYADLGYDSTFLWLVEDLGYSNAAADRRLKAARLLRDVPEAVSDLESGAVNLTTLSKVQRAIQGEEKRTGQRLNVRQKRTLANQIRTMSGSATEQLLAQTFPESSVAKERLTEIDENRSRLNLILSKEQRKKLERVREIASRSDVKSFAEVIEWMTDQLLKKKDPLRIETTDPSLATSTSAPEEKLPRGPQRGKRKNHLRRQIPTALARLVRRRDGDSCSYIDPRSGRRCGSRVQIQLDHIVPIARGGSDDASNLRCLCRTHNLRMAERTFGTAWMNERRGAKWT